jgi:hypothetical protein
MLFAIHSVFIAKENILFLEEWLDYHIQLGFDKFYLYDNSKVRRSSGCHPNHKCFIPGHVNKYGINYDQIVNLTPDEITDILLQLKNKYSDKIVLSEWSPTDKNGVVLFNQKQAHNDCLAKLKEDNITWCANIDMDEYIVLKGFASIVDYVNSIHGNISCVHLSQIRFESRFLNLDKRVIEITKSENSQLGLRHSNKNLFKVDNTDSLDVHTWKGNGSVYSSNLNGILFNHYKLNEGTSRIINNINLDILNKVKQNSIDYINVRR